MDHLCGSVIVNWVNFNPPGGNVAPLFVHKKQAINIGNIIPHCTQGLFTHFRSSTHRSSTHGVLKIRSCSRFDSRVILAWSLKNKELFQIGLLDHTCVAGVQVVDRPCVAGVQLVDRPRVEPYKPGGVPDPHFFFLFCDPAGLFN